MLAACLALLCCATGEARIQPVAVSSVTGGGHCVATLIDDMPKWVSVKGGCIRAAFTVYRQPEPIKGLLAGAGIVLAVGKRCVHFVLDRGKKPVCPSQPAGGAGQEIRDAALTDLDGDGKPGLVLLLRADDSGARGRLVGVNLEDGRQGELAVEPLDGAWGLDSGDLDGDGKEELLVGVYKRAYHDPRMAKRLRVYSYRPAHGSLAPLWRGTRMGHKLLDFTTGPVDAKGHALLAVLEDLDGGKRRITLYGWHYFGFWAERSLSANQGINRLARFIDRSGKVAVVALREIQQEKYVQRLLQEAANKRP